MVGGLFTDAHWPQLIAHPLFNLGVDSTSSSSGPRWPTLRGAPSCTAATSSTWYITYVRSEL